MKELSHGIMPPDPLDSGVPYSVDAPVVQLLALNSETDIHGK